MHEEEELGLRERKKRATRTALQYAALELVAKHGLEQVTVEMITAKVGISARTFFNYFPTKEDSLIDVDPDRLEQQLANLATRPADEPPLLSLRAMLMADAPRVTAAKEAWRLRFALGAQYPEIFHAAASASARFERAITLAISERLGTNAAVDPLPRLVTGVASAARRTALHIWVHEDFTEPYADILTRCFDQLVSLLPSSA